MTPAQHAALVQARALLTQAGLSDYTITPPPTHGTWTSPDGTWTAEETPDRPGWARYTREAGHAVDPDDEPIYETTAALADLGYTRQTL